MCNVLSDKLLWFMSEKYFTWIRKYLSQSTLMSEDLPEAAKLTS